MISIHAPRRGSDQSAGAPDIRWSDFNPRSPQGERPKKINVNPTIFHFNPRSPQGERPNQKYPMMRHQNFNPRSPQGERLAVVSMDNFVPEFQSTLPAGGATAGGSENRSAGDNFNPRSPQGERRHQAYTLRAVRHFNPRSPQGERPDSMVSPLLSDRHFNPRSPQGERQRLYEKYINDKTISIHAPRRGSDFMTVGSTTTTHTFQSTLPAGGATIV